MADRVGEQFGKYRLEQLLGHGGFADVYLGEHVYLKSQAAIKILHARVDADDTTSFLNEARMVAGLQHPHIVRVLDFDVTAEGLPFFVMEYAPNGSLRRRYARGTRLPLDMIVSYTKQVAAALQYAHNQKLIHCDVKPENMLLSSTNQVVLSDFGVAVIAQTSRSHNMQEITGTAAYMAPEQFQGKASPASDQYALAIVVYEWLTGYYPFHGTLTEIITQHMMVPPRPLREVVPTLSADIEQVIFMGLAKDPKQRFARVEAFANALEQASRSSLTMPSDSATFIVPDRFPSDSATFITPGMLPTQIASTTGPTLTPSDPNRVSNPALPAYPSMTPPYNPMIMAQVTPPAEVSANEPGHTVKVVEPAEEKKQQPFVSRRGLLIGIVGIATLATGGTLFALAEKSNLFSFMQTPTTVPTHTATAGPTTAPSQSPTQQDPHPQQPTQQPTTQPPPTILTYYTYAGPSAMYTAAWSPDGTKIATAGNGPTIEILSASSGAPLFSLSTGASIVYSVAWSPDNSRIVSGQSDGTIQIWNATTGNNLTSWQGHSAKVNSVAWSPNGNAIASGGGGTDKTAKIWDANTYSLITSYTGHAHYIDSVAWSSDSNTVVSSGGDATAQVWNAATGNWIYTYSGHNSEVVAVSWMPNGTRIASASVDKTVQVWEATTGTTYINYTQHASTVNTVAWSPDASRIASGGLDDRVRVWGAASGNTLLIYAEHTDQIQSVAWSPNSTKIASASNDGTVKVWKAT